MPSFLSSGIFSAANGCRRLVGTPFFGLPLAIIGLFIADTLDRQGAKAPAADTTSQQPTPSTSAMSQEGDRRRRIVYGGYSANATALAPLSRDPVVIFGGHLLQLVGAITVIYVIFHFIDKYW
jgi:hypothetical protein